MRNQDVARMLQDIAAALELMGESSFKVRAYQEAARSLEYMTEDVATLARENRLDEIPGVGASIAEKIRLYLERGHSPYLERLIQEIPPGVFDLLKVPGIGPRRANQLFRQLNVTSLPELAAALRAHRVRELPGMGARSEAAMLKELARLEARSTRLPLGVAMPLAEKVAEALRDLPFVLHVEPAGSIRRRRETVGDIDLVAASHHPEKVEKAIASLAVTREVLSSGPTKITFLTHDQFQVDVRVVPPSTWGAALHHFTGSKAHNIALRDRALQRGLRINEYGIFKLDTGKRIGGATEEEIYEVLGLEWMPPELRENRGEIEAAEIGALPRLVTLEDIRGDFHCHTRYSDGSESIETMVVAAIARGYDFIVITDHSHGLGVTHGLTAERAAEQRRVIDALNRRYAPFRILAGVELEIRANGELDFPDAVLEQFDVVTASVHTGIKQESERITARMVGALENPHVHILNHPTGRLLSRRPPYEFDFDAVLDAASRSHKALEINGSWDRMDLNDIGARHAKEAGVMLSLGSDAHSVEGLDAMRLAVALARRAWLEPGDLLNTLKPDALLRRLKGRRVARRR